MLTSIGLSLLLSVGVLSSIRTESMSDKKKIEKIFEYTGTIVKSQKGDIKKPMFVRKEGLKGSNGMEYVYRLPLGLPSKLIQKLNDNIGVFKDGLHKNIEIQFNEGMLHMYVYEDDLPNEWSYKHAISHINKGSWSIPVGKTHKGVVYRDFDKIPHTVIGGTTRYGKTVCLKSMMTSLILSNPDDAEFYIIDLKRKLEFGKYENIKQVKGVSGTPEESLEMLEGLLARVESLMKYFGKNGFTNIVDTPISKRIFVVIDEANRLVPENRSDKIKMKIKSYLEDVASVMGGLGVRLIFCTQYPVATTLPRDIKQNSDAKMSFRLQNKYASEVVLGEENGQSADLPDIAGRCITIHGSNIFEMQTPLITDEQMMNLLVEYYNEGEENEGVQHLESDIQIRDGE